MGTLRYVLALLVVASLPGALFFWFLVHPFVSFWRRIGAAWSYTILLSFLAINIAVMAGLRDLLLGGETPLTRDFGTNHLLAAIGLACLAATARLRYALRGRLTMNVLFGLPEIAPDRHPVRLLTDGIYARVRHPRYLQVLIGITGCALIANHAASYVAAALTFPVIYLIVRLEESELRARFGEEYREYCRRVPRFLPRRRPRGTTAGSGT